MESCCVVAAQSRGYHSQDCLARKRRSKSHPQADRAQALMSYAGINSDMVFEQILKEFDAVAEEDVQLYKKRDELE